MAKCPARQNRGYMYGLNTNLAIHILCAMKQVLQVTIIILKWEARVWPQRTKVSYNFWQVQQLVYIKRLELLTWKEKMSTTIIIQINKYKTHHCVHYMYTCYSYHKTQVLVQWKASNIHMLHRVLLVKLTVSATWIFHPSKASGKRGVQRAGNCSTEVQHSREEMLVFLKL